VDKHYPNEVSRMLSQMKNQKQNKNVFKHTHTWGSVTLLNLSACNLLVHFTVGMSIKLSLST